MESVDAVQYNRLIEAINAGEIREIWLSVRGYAHYNKISILCTRSAVSPQDVNVVIRPVQDDSEPRIHCFHGFDENIPIVSIKGKGRLTLRQIWDLVEITDIKFAPQEDIPSKGKIRFVLDDVDHGFRFVDVWGPTLAAQLSVHGRLRIEMDGAIVFDKTVCPLELHCQFATWDKAVSRGKIKNFCYVSAESPSQPILSFKRSMESDLWAFVSPFATRSEPTTCTLEDIKACFTRYHAQLFRMSQ